MTAIPWVPDDERYAALAGVWSEFEAACPEEMATVREAIEQGAVALSLAPPLGAPGVGSVDRFASREPTPVDMKALAAHLAQIPEVRIAFRRFATDFNRLWARYEFDMRYNRMTPRQRKDYRRRARKGMVKR